MLHEVGWVDRVRLQLEEEVDAGRRVLLRGRSETFFEELNAGTERAQKRLELEQEQGRRTAARQPVSTGSA
jgi:hypothetical protein